MNKEEIFEILEKNLITYRDLKTIPVEDNYEKFIKLSETSIFHTTENHLVTPSTGNEIYVRIEVAKKLEIASKYVEELFPKCSLEVVYGFRSLKVQTETYEKVKEDIKKISQNYSEDELNEEIHRFIAVPDVAGHPTGGAVDVRIIDNSNNVIDMGTQAQEFVKESYSFFPLVTKEIWLNRQKLRQAMLSAGFAPFDGEWWHFSYGDKEWAKYYNKPNAIYAQVNLDEQGNIL